MRVDKTAIDLAEKPRPRHSRRGAVYPRKRASQACHTCRFRRTKCDNVRPACTACLKLGAECVYGYTNPSTFDPASLVILQKINDLEKLIQPRANELPATPSTGVGQISLPASQNDFSSLVDGPSTHWARYLINLDTVLQWPPFEDCDCSSRLVPISPIADKNAYSDPKTLPLSVDIDLPTSEILLQSFFGNVHIFNPILEEEAIREHVKTLNGIGWDAMSCLLLLIYAHGSISTPFRKNMSGLSPPALDDSITFHQAESYFLAAQIRMGALFYDGGVIAAQSFFIAGMYLMATLRPLDARKMFVQALACCQALFNHEGATSASSEGKWNQEQNIYWTCFKSELELRLELNLPRMNDSEFSYPNFFPSPPDRLNTKDEVAWYFYLAEIALQRLRNRVLRYIGDKHHNTEMQNVISDFQEQMDALHSLPEPLAFNCGDSGKEQDDALRFILNGHFLDCQETVYWQFIVNIVHGSPYRESDQVYLRKGLKVCVDRIQQNRQGFFYRHHGTWLMLRSCTRSAFVLLAAVRYTDLKPFLPVGWKEAVLDVTRMLWFWKDESRDIYEMLTILTMYMERWLSWDM
ncbi:hypothetical protein BGW36DRAFT_307812 [Talaromyces proteolyticus]|uniref:Zn(2)-C6 fungal-type domain-containing protein n=1 Tax=Talaromyces proteolyticus TaxID=1131652 RepID=A0AAD4KG57_9EURO|nr:uncharacterized protein BGW36DRAFT_307812 [Talaromyces proteolyticus]KAH8690338.1 hypothetical protein BGW36DRAFT_307812 [Talaromyces proteolyticus]